MERTEADSHEPIPGRDRALSGRVLLACADAAEGRRLERLLTAAGLEVTLTGDTEAAVGRALQTAFDLILLDLELAPADGTSAVELLEAVGHDDPRLALTTDAGPDVAPDEGFAAALPRNADADQVLDCLARLLPAASADGWRGSGRWRDTEAFAELVADYLGELPDVAGELRRARDQGDLEAVAGIAHRVKGTAGNLGLDGLSTAAATLQQAARGGSAVDDLPVRSAFAALDAELAAFGTGTDPMAYEAGR